MAAARCVASTSRAALVDAAGPRALKCSCGSAGPSRPRTQRALCTAIPHRSSGAVAALPARRSLSSTSRLGATMVQTDSGRGDASLPPSMLGAQAGAGSATQLAQDTVLPTSMLAEPDLKRLKRMRNIGISAHVDSGKTTLTERVLFYTGRIKAIHEVRGKDEVGAKMDSMELEREKGITIQSAATFCDWQIRAASNEDAVGAYKINIIDTPGHVDFTIEVERALRVLDGAVLVLCAVSGVQSQSITVDRQMRRYNVPRISFINKMDRAGANPFRVVDQIRSKLKIPAALIQLPIGAEDAFEGVFDLVRMVAVRNAGEKGVEVVESAELSAELLEAAQAKRSELIETLADVDDELAELFLDEQPISNAHLQDAIRRATIARRFSPVVVGTALGNTAIQPLLDAVCTYLPAPNEVAPSSLGALDVAQPGHPAVQLVPAVRAPFVGLAFKLEEGKFGQLTYVRVYQGTLARGAFLVNARTGKRVKVPKLVRMHSNEMEEVQSVGAGEICAVYGIECASGDTFTDGASVSMTPMFVPDPVISLSIRPKGQETPAFSRAINRFQREDPTFQVRVDNESGETIISGMGELHLEIYVERMRREYNIECVTGKPQVAFRETITRPATFAYTHKKQSGGAGQFARVVGRIEPVTEPDEDTGVDTDFQNELIGTNISEAFVPAIKKGFEDSLKRGSLTNHPVTGVRFVLEDGAMHAVDSSELAFRTAAQGAFREAFANAGPVVLEPIIGPEFQGQVVSLVNQRRGMIVESEIGVSDFTLLADVGLSDMFGFSSSLRAATAGKAEFTMEFLRYAPVNPGVQKEMIESARKFSTAPKA